MLNKILKLFINFYESSAKVLSILYKDKLCMPLEAVHAKKSSGGHVSRLGLRIASAGWRRSSPTSVTSTASATGWERSPGPSMFRDTNTGFLCILQSCDTAFWEHQSWAHRSLKSLNCSSLLSKP